MVGVGSTSLNRRVARPSWKKGLQHQKHSLMKGQQQACATDWGLWALAALPRCSPLQRWNSTRKSLMLHQLLPVALRERRPVLCPRCQRVQTWALSPGWLWSMRAAVCCSLPQQLAAGL